MVAVALCATAVLALASRSSAPPVAVQSAAPASTQLERTNRCTLLPSRPRTATIHHGCRPPILPAGEVCLVISGDASDERYVAVTATYATAVSSRCRQLVRELGTVTEIWPSAQGGPLAVSAMRALSVRRLRAAYVGATVSSEAAAEEASAREEGEEAAAIHRCEVSFARRGVRATAAALGGHVGRWAWEAPLLGVGLRAATALGARIAADELTPTYRPTWTLRALKRLPWRMQRLGARVWLQAMMRAEDATTEGYWARGGSTRAQPNGQPNGQPIHHHPMAAIRTLPLLDATQCEAAIDEAEAYARARGGWQTDRHVSYPTTDIPIRHLPALQAVWDSHIFPTFAAAYRRSLQLPASAEVRPLDVFVVKYDAAGQTELAVHRDNGLLTFSLLLNEPADFEGGGTYFEAAGRVYRPSRGVGVLHSALVRHAGYPIRAGTRYVLVGFCGLSAPQLPRGIERWQFGDPPWYVTSRVVADAQILQRVWPMDADVTRGGAGEGRELRGTGAGSGDLSPAPVADGDEYPTLEEMLESGELSRAEYDELMSSGVDASGGADAAEGGDEYPTLEEMLESGELSRAEYDELMEGTSPGAQAATEAPYTTVEASAADHTPSGTTISDAAVGDTPPEVGGGAGEKPWYRAQHAAAALARTHGELIEQHGEVHDGLQYELWRSGSDLVAMLVRPSAEDGGAQSAGHSEMGSSDGRDGGPDELGTAATVVGSLTFRDGPLTSDMRALLGRLLPSHADATGVPLIRWVRRRRQVAKLAGVVHVYLLPTWRGGSRGTVLTRYAMHSLATLGYSHVLTLADDRGSGKLRQWYESLGFVDASEFTETAMVASTRDAA